MFRPIRTYQYGSIHQIWFCSWRGLNHESLDYESNTLTTAPSNPDDFNEIGTRELNQLIISWGPCIMLISTSIHYHRELKFSGLNKCIYIYLCKEWLEELGPTWDCRREGVPSICMIYLGKVGLEDLMDKLTRSHLGPGGKESHQCLVCAKWYAVPPIKHMRSHILTLR